MPTPTAPLPLTNVVEPADQAELAARLRDCHEQSTAVYPLGGGTSLEYGLTPRQSGLGMSLKNLCRIVDYPARDLTVTVEAGVTMATLTQALAAENQELPLDVPRTEQATIGGVVATNWNGPRRYGCGTVRDHVIGISAVDGRGIPFKGGGRVVKNVAGYDFCKLLTGSLGTLGVIAQVTLKLRPRCERSVVALAAVRDLDQAELLLERLVHSETRPSAIELLGGPEWRSVPEVAEMFESPGATVTSTGSNEHCVLAVGLEGTAAEVEWMQQQINEEWRTAGLKSNRFVVDSAAQDLWRRLAEFPAASDAPLLLKASVVPSGVTKLVRAIQQIDADASFQSHAGNGIVIARFAKFPDGGLSRSLLSVLQPVAAAAHGRVVVLSNPSGAEATRQSWWGGLGAPGELMASVKRQFDPKNLLNPGRFVFP